MSVNKNKPEAVAAMATVSAKAENDYKYEILLRAYSCLREVTPKKYDCGILCSSVCCRENSAHGCLKDGDGHNGICGMLLLPGEKELLSGAMEFEFFTTPEGGDILVCNSSCVRELRPFACRIFPFYPKFEKCGSGYTVKILPDPRSFGICPIARDFRKRKASAAFFRAAKRAVRILMSDDEILNELILQSEMISDIALLKDKLRLSRR